ncbi:hypothetical protein PC121_g20705 [Phytophthora cactorum]|nr:hypothetical protein PC121_g20705 [Phytophthora cactorum]
MNRESVHSLSELRLEGRRLALGRSVVNHHSVNYDRLAEALAAENLPMPRPPSRVSMFGTSAAGFDPFARRGDGMSAYEHFVVQDEPDVNKENVFNAQFVQRSPRLGVFPSPQGSNPSSFVQSWSSRNSGGGQDTDDEFVDACRHSPAESSIGDAANRVQSPYPSPAMSTASASSTDTIILEDATKSEVAEDVGESPAMLSPVYVSILREAPGEPRRDSSTVPARVGRGARPPALQDIANIPAPTGMLASEDDETPSRRRSSRPRKPTTRAVESRLQRGKRSRR